MVKFLIILFFVNKAFAVEILMEKDGHKQIVKIPDDAQQVVLKMERSNSGKKDKIYLKISREKSKKNKPCRACKPNKTLKSAKKKLPPQLIPPKTIIIASKYNKNNYYSEKTTKTQEIVNVYHYFYPCSMNPQMKDCTPDQKIKIDNNTDRLVVVNENGSLAKIDMVDQRAGIKKVLPIKENEDTSSHQKSFPRNSPMFDATTYHNNQLPTNDPYVTINDPIYQKRTLRVLSDKNLQS